MGNRLIIVVGHFGSGKTEFAMNYAINRSKQGQKVRMADLDIANPYFRSREQAESLKQYGINIISNNFDNDWKIDLPALNAGIKTFFEDESSDIEYVVDVGGNPEGARVLRQYLPVIKKRESYDMWLVTNASRLETQTAEKMLDFAKRIEFESGIACTGIINNTHFIRDTKSEDILHGDRLAKELSENMEIPVVYTVAEEHIVKELDARALAGEVFPISLRVRFEYM